MDTHFSQSRLIWNPIQPSLSRVEALRRMINRNRNLNLKDYHDLHEYSVSDYAFWEDLWQFLAISYSAPPTEIMTTGHIKEVPVWFPGARLNYAENLLWRNDDAIALTATGELGKVTSCSFRQLRSLVQAMAGAMKAKGLQVGDRVAAIVANNVTAVVIALATASIGGIFSSTATDMGTQGILDRYRQINPKLLFSETEVVYAGKTIDLLPKISAVAKDLANHGLEHAILLPSVKTGDGVHGAALSDIPKGTSLSAFLAARDSDLLTFKQLPFNHPLYILYSSGTSGPPKCIVHSAGGVLVQSKKDLTIHFSLDLDDTYFQYTTTAWMMWPYMLSALSCGARLILYDGSPFYPDVKTYLKFVDSEGITLLGTSPRFLAEVQGQGIHPLDLGRFEALRTIASTGAVLTSPMFEWVQSSFGPKKHIVSSSGGTDICAAFVTSVPTLPVYAGEIQAKALGMKVEVFGPLGDNIEHTGQAGELVCTRPHPSIPVRFWGDDDKGTKFLKAYYDVYPGVWRQGDFIALNPRTRGLVIYGRSDGVLNPSGVRFGSGEIYTVLERFSALIDDSICVGQRRPADTDERVLLFIKMRAGHRLTGAVEQAMREAIRKALSARHVPKYIFEVEEIPYTVNNKKIEIAVKQIISGTDIQPSGTVANPGSLKLYYKYRDLEGLVGARAKL